MGKTIILSGIDAFSKAMKDAERTMIKAATAALHGTFVNRERFPADGHRCRARKRAGAGERTGTAGCGDPVYHEYERSGDSGESEETVPHGICERY